MVAATRAACRSLQGVSMFSPNRRCRGSGCATLRFGRAPPIWYQSRVPTPVLRALAALVLAGCSSSAPPGYQGYVEGEFVNVASPIAGRLDQLSVRRGDDVAVNARLYALEAVSEAAAQRQAQEQLRAAEAQL